VENSSRFYDNQKGLVAAGFSLRKGRLENSSCFYGKK
jgi:hypothetical protein